MQGEGVKSILAASVLVFVLVGTIVLHRVLTEDKNQQAVVAWSNSLVWDALGTEVIPDFADQETQLRSATGTWLVSGRLSYRRGAAAVVRGTYVASIRQVCPSRTTRECWELTRLAINNEEVDLAARAAVRTTSNQAMEQASDAPQSGESPPTGEKVRAGDTDVEASDDASAETSEQSPNSREPAQEAAVEPTAPVVPPIEPADETTLVLEIQTRLNIKGFEVGPPDGITGPRTRAAIRAYQEQNGLPISGDPTIELLRHLAGR